MEKVLFLSAPLVERIWGGNYFKNTLKVTDNDNNFGEMWSVSALKSNSSLILNGIHRGKKLYEVFEEYPQLFNNPSYKEFPILIKVIATRDDLSVQVHPDDEYAKTYENQSGKTEGWLILDHKENSSIILGHNANSKQELIEYINNHDYDALLNKVKVKKGEFYPINSGTIHALGKDIVLLEIQQSSDVTYRFYDYDRVDKNGQKRELHVKKAVDVTTIGKYNETIINCFNDNIKTIWDNKYFKVELYNVNNELQLNNETYSIVSVVDGNIKVLDKTLKLGDSFIITSNAKSLTVKGNGKLVVTTSK